jgi:hypothetical protein
MKRHRLAIASVAVFVVMLTAACTETPSPSPSPEIVSASPSIPGPPADAIAVPTYPTMTEINGVPIGCDAIGVERPVWGALEGDSADPAKVWLRTRDGARLDIAWPAGFFVRFEPEAVLYDASNEVVARTGEIILLQVELGSAAGTVDDPYLATGILIAGPTLDPNTNVAEPAYSGCYAVRPAG